MDHQHHNYEYNETFGFINAAFGENVNFPLSQEDIPKTMPDFDSTAASTNNEYNNPSIYGIPSDPVQNYPDSQNLCAENEKEQSEQMIEDHQDTENVQSRLEAIIEKSPDELNQNVEQATECLEQFKGEEITEKTIESEKSNDIADTSNLDPKQAKKDTPYKKRRRIMILNDDSDEDELKKELLGKSSDVEENKDPEKSQDIENFADNEADESENEKISEIPVNKNFLKAKSLLQSAVIIQGPDKKKKKKQRVLESDDEDQLQTSIDDIGLISEENDFENEGEMLESDIVILNDNPFEAVENSTENLDSTIPTDQVAEQKESTDNVNEESKTVENSPQKSPKPEKSDESKEDQSIAEKKEEEDVDAILDKIQPMDDDDDFFKFNDSSEEENDKSVPNDEYFGTPDKSSGTSTGKKRGPKPGSRRKTENSRPAPRSRKRGSKYEKDFVDDSESSSSSYSESLSSSSESSTEIVSRPKVKPVVKKPPVVKAQTIVQKTIPVQRPIVAQRPTVPINRPIVKKDRFFDKSRLIPNDVYFGDVKVPLHVLHSRWNSDGSERTVRRPVNVPMSRNIPKVASIPSTSKTAPVQNIRVQHDEDTKLTVLKEFINICGLKINYAKLFSNAKSTDHKCMMLRRILAQKGMEGEPTLAKCKKLKREMQAKRESAELDKSVILNTEGRTRRSRRGVSSRESDESLGTSNNEVDSPKPSVPPQVLETLTKIKSVIDSDSE